MFLESALVEGKRYEAQVAQDLSSVVFGRVFPSLVKALAEDSGEELAEVRQAALIFLYRLLFVLYAEDRGLLPVNDTRYDDYGMRKRVRDDVADRMAGGDRFSKVAPDYYNRLKTLCRLIDKGDASIGLPPYNGGLFAPDAAPLLGKVELSDEVVAPIVYDPRATQRRKGSAGSSTTGTCRCSSLGRSTKGCWSRSRCGTTAGRSSFVRTHTRGRTAAASSRPRSWWT